jgi:cellulose synthase/poly-beta-1,6-N-acetylglucosamine synthase-like glycosyltransferase
MLRTLEELCVSSPELPIFAKLIFWICTATVIAVYIGYPILIFVLSRLFGRNPLPPRQVADELPSVSLLIAAFNEEIEIEARILNALALDYPRDKLEIVIASDGSTDRTNDIVRKYAAQGVRLFAYEQNRGKTTVLNTSVPQLRGEIVVLSDANTHMAADAVRRLASWFRDSAIGVVCGRLVLTDPRTGRNVDGVYWKYETFLKKCESRLGALLGSNGAIYAIRKSLFPFVRPGTLIDDFVIPLDAKRQSGCRIIYDTRAVACEETAPTIRAEFRRRVRIGAGGYQSIGMLWPLLSPVHGWVAMTFFFHKILRWTCPFFLIGSLATNAVLLGSPLYDWLFAGQVGFYAAALAGNWIPARPRWLRYLRLPTLFTSMNIALFFGFFRWLFGKNTGVWKRTDRTAPDPIAAEPDLQPAGSVS